MSVPRIGRRGQVLVPSTAARPYAGRQPHWIRGNAQERIPHRWIVADTESDSERLADGEQLRFKLAVAVRWRDDLKTGDGEQWLQTTSPLEFWQWVTGHCWTHGRTVLWFHNSSHDLGQLDAFRILPELGYELVWCNLDRNVSVVSWRGPQGTLLIADTYTWIPESLEKLAPLTGMSKPPLPHKHDDEAAWWARCRADVEITRRVVAQLLEFIRTEHLGNWQPSGAGMGHTAFRHRFMTDKLLVHDDSDALDAEREAMHTGRAEAWWHGQARGGPYTEYDMHMSYCRIAAECLIPGKLWDHDVKPSKKVHQFGLDYWRTLARVRVTTSVPVVPARINGRITWPTGQFDTTLWDTELALITETGGSYTVYEQWRYTRKPALQAWARWSMDQCALPGDRLSPIARMWVKHQSRAVIGRFALRTPTWEEWGENWLHHTGISFITDHETGTTTRMMHCGSKVLAESERTEAANSVPQITSWIMAEARARLWRAAAAAGLDNVLHVDTDSMIVSKAGASRLETLGGEMLPGGWRAKSTWRTLVIVGPRHYTAPGRRQIPGVPARAVRQPDGSYLGEVWDSLARSLTEDPSTAGRIRTRTYHPKHTDHRRPYQGEINGPALPPAITPDKEPPPNGTRDLPRADPPEDLRRRPDHPKEAGSNLPVRRPRLVAGRDGHVHRPGRPAAAPDRVPPPDPQPQGDAPARPARSRTR